jgi:hypothetical protein
MENTNPSVSQLKICQDVMNINNLADWLHIRSESGKQSFKDGTLRTKADLQLLRLQSEQISKIRNIAEHNPEFSEEADTYFTELQTIEADLTDIFSEKNELEKESYNELLFTKPLWQPINFIPFLLSIWAFIRVYALPFISFLVPIMTLIVPYVLIRYVFKLPIQFGMYTEMVSSILSGSSPFNLTSIASASSSAATSVAAAPTSMIDAILPKNITQIFFLGVSIIQGLIQPYWTYVHLHNVDTQLKRKEESLISLKTIYNNIHNLFQKYGIDILNSPLKSLPNDRQILASAIIHPTNFKYTLRILGDLDVLFHIATHKKLCIVDWKRNLTYNIYNTYDYQIPENKCNPFTITNLNHALLTGPNRGGKSSVLRALTCSSVLAHTYGVAIGTKCEMSVFKNIFVNMSSDDLPGEESRFEKEVIFTSNTIRTNEPSIILIDELYHTTNPPDALLSCKKYCNYLWNKTNSISIISTHLFELVENAPKTIQKLCCPAHIEPETKKVVFSYSLTDGICRVSSVDELLEKYGI